MKKGVPTWGKWDFSEYVQSLIRNKRLKVSKIKNASCLTPHDFFNIIHGICRPSRVKVLSLAIGMKLTIPETQRLLAKADYRELNPADPWDAVVMDGLEHKYSVLKIDDMLQDAGGTVSLFDEEDESETIQTMADGLYACPQCSDSQRRGDTPAA